MGNLRLSGLYVLAASINFITGRGTKHGAAVLCIENCILLVAPIVYAWLFNVRLGKEDAFIGLLYAIAGLILVVAALLVGFNGRRLSRMRQL